MSAATTSSTTILSPPQSIIVDMSNNNVGNVSENVLEKQNQMNKIIDQEMARLDSKKSTVDDIVSSKERMYQLNTNFIERKQEYQKMMIALIIGLAICIILYTVNNFLPIPSVLITLILIVTFAGVFIYCFNVYLVIVNRDRMDFQKIDTTPPVIDTKNQGQSTGGGNLLDGINMGMCLGSSCCSEETTWDVSAQLCVPAASATTGRRDGFEPLLKVDSNSFKNVSQTVFLPQHFSLNEFEKYSVYL
jgi:hypothetical protein